MPYAAALSQHPLATHAVGEVVGHVLETLGPAPDLAVLFASAPHTGVMEDVGRAVRELLDPGVLVGCTAATIVGGAREVEEGPALSLWAASGVRAAAHLLSVRRTPDGIAISGFPGGDEVPADVQALLVLADPFSFPVDHLLSGLRDQVGIELPVIGGLASAGRGPGGNRLVLDGDVFSEGALVVTIAGATVEAVVSQGCRPIGEPMIVTRGEGSLVHELAGQPALQRVHDILRALTPDEIEMARHGLHVGRVVDESKAEFERGDFLVRNVLGADSAVGAVALGDEVEVGATIQFHVRDAVSADEDLRHLMGGRHAASALVFTCNGRGTHLFGTPDHDASIIADALGAVPVAGMSCAGEIGPVGGRSFLHGFTASVALFRDR